MDLDINNSSRAARIALIQTVPSYEQATIFTDREGLDDGCVTVMSSGAFTDSGLGHGFDEFELADRSILLVDPPPSSYH